MRFEIWKVQFEEMEADNEENSNFTEKENCFMDETEEEFKSRHEGLNPPSKVELKKL